MRHSVRVQQPNHEIATIWTETRFEPLSLGFSSFSFFICLSLSRSLLPPSLSLCVYIYIYLIYIYISLSLSLPPLSLSLSPLSLSLSLSLSLPHSHSRSFSVSPPLSLSCCPKPAGLTPSECCRSCRPSPWEKQFKASGRGSVPGCTHLGLRVVAATSTWGFCGWQLVQHGLGPLSLRAGHFAEGRKSKLGNSTYDASNQSNAQSQAPPGWRWNQRPKAFDTIQGPCLRTISLGCRLLFTACPTRTKLRKFRSFRGLGLRGPEGSQRHLGSRTCPVRDTCSPTRVAVHQA